VKEQQLRLRLEALGAGPSSADWADSRGRAERLRRRRTTLVVGLAAAAILVAVPALALATGTVDFWSAEPAESYVVHAFDAMDRYTPDGYPRSDGRDARKVLTRTFSDDLLTDGTWTLSVGPRKTGGFCFFVSGPRGGGAGCTNANVPLSVGAFYVDRLSPAVIHGSVTNPEAAYVEIVLRGGRSKRTELVWVSEPIDAAFFMDRIAKYGELGTVVLRSADGAKLASRQF
jgi:hypothetical protein